MDFLIRAMLQHEAFVLCGVSDGALQELKAAMERMPRMPIYIMLFLDPGWQTKYEKLKNLNGDPLLRLKSRRTIITLTGKRGVGKTWGSAYAIDRFPDRLARILSTTTRPPRGGDDAESYHFVSTKEFAQNLADGLYIEHDRYEGIDYGIDAMDIEKRLGDNKVGIIAVTSLGVKALLKEYGDLARIIPILIDCPEALHRKNLNKRRDIRLQDYPRLIAGTSSTELSGIGGYFTLRLEDDGDIANAWRFVEVLNPYNLFQKIQTIETYS